MNLYDIIVVRNVCEEIGKIKSFLRGGRLDIASLHWLNETTGKVYDALEELLEKMEREVTLDEDTRRFEASEGHGQEDPEAGQEPESEARVE